MLFGQVASSQSGGVEYTTPRWSERVRARELGVACSGTDRGLLRARCGE